MWSGAAQTAPTVTRTRRRILMTTKRTCSIDDCEKPVSAHGWCGMHYQRWRRHGRADLPTTSYKRGGLEWLKDQIADGDRSECWEWPYGRFSAGYGSLQYDGWCQKAHRVACILDGRPVPKGLVARHQCHNPPCCNPDHILEGTQQQNIDDTIRDGRKPRGTKTTMAKLTEYQVLAILDRLANGETMTELADEHGVTIHAIFRIKSGKSWKWLTGL